MTISNHISLDDVCSMPVPDIGALPAKQLALLQNEAAQRLSAAKTLGDGLDAAITLKYSERAQSARRAVRKDTGTIRFHDGAVTVIAALPKKVDWNQAMLAALVERIRADGADPAEYIDVEFDVAERKFAAWPSHIRDAFAPARTVRTGKPRFRLTLREEVR